MRFGSGVIFFTLRPVTRLRLEGDLLSSRYPRGCQARRLAAALSRADDNSCESGCQAPPVNALARTPAKGYRLRGDLLSSLYPRVPLTLLFGPGVWLTLMLPSPNNRVNGTSVHGQNRRSSRSHEEIRITRSVRYIERMSGTSGQRAVPRSGKASPTSAGPSFSGLPCDPVPITQN